jgi:geranylgeranylglycerol-phosphate geranylgeranyltransferase
MHTVIRSGRFYFWPIITANIVMMTIAIDGKLIPAVILSLVISCLASFGFLLNDIWDRNVDRVNKAGHFEHADTATVRIGVVALLVFLTAGLLIAFWLGPHEFSIGCIIALGLGSYTILLRKFLFIPTLIAALLAASPLWAPLFLWAENVGMLKGAFVAAIITMIAAREIIMDTRDRAGDVVGGRDTFATIFGAKIAKLVAVILTLSASLLFVVTVIANAFGLPVVNMLISLAVTGIILYLLLRPALGTILNAEEERTAIQRYVISSRWAMGLIPLLVYSLWH